MTNQVRGGFGSASVGGGGVNVGRGNVVAATNARQASCDDRTGVPTVRTMPPHVIAKPPATKAYTLWDRKADRMPVTNWSYVPMPEEALSRLQVGDAVRLLLMDSDGGSGWEKIYFEITSIDYYSKGALNALGSSG